MQFVTLTADGELDLGSVYRDSVVALVYTDTFGGGTLTFGTRDPSETFAAFTDPVPATVVGNTSVFLGKGTTLTLKLLGATTPNLIVGIASEAFTYATGVF